MRGGLERLGANTDSLVQMQALSQRLAQHRTLSVLSADSNQPPLAASLSSGSGSKGPHLPLRPKLQQTKQGSAINHTHSTTMSTSPQTMHKQLPSIHSSAGTDQENDVHSRELHTAHPWQAAPPSYGTLPTAHQAEAADHSHTGNDWRLPSSTLQGMAGAGGAVSRDFNALATPGQLAAGLQQSILGQSQAASDIAAEQQDPLLPVSYPDRPADHLGESQHLV